LKDGESNTLGCLVAIHETFLRIRESMRELSKLSDAPIEPPEQTRLLDACMNIPGVLLAGVPGAGGYDAILCLTIGKEAKTRLEEMWILLESHQTICPMLSVVDSNGVQRDSSNMLFNLKPEAFAIS
jgi:phosphomevalonate kinase